MTSKSIDDSTLPSASKTSAILTTSQVHYINYRTLLLPASVISCGKADRGTVFAQTVAGDVDARAEILQLIQELYEAHYQKLATATVQEATTSHNEQMKGILDKHQVVIQTLRDNHQAEIKALRDKLDRKKAEVKLLRQNVEQLKEANSDTKISLEKVRGKFHAASKAERNLLEDNRRLQDSHKFLQQELLRFKMVTGSRIGLQTQHDYWVAELAKTSPYNRRVPLPVGPVGPAEPGSNIARLTGRTFKTEAAMYKPIVALLRKLFPNVAIEDTHGNRYLNDRAPDITFFLKDVRQVVSDYVMTLMEVKRTTERLAARHMGQALDQLHRVADAQPYRKHFTMLVTNIKHNRFIHLQRHENELLLYVFADVNFETALEYLKEIVADGRETPAKPPFSSELGLLQRLLGNTANSIVGEFSVDGCPVGMVPVNDYAAKRSVAVKHASSPKPCPLKTEIDILLTIKNHGGHPNLPNLAFYSSTYTAFAMTPVGQKIVPRNLNNDQKVAQAVLSDVLSAISWLHEHNIVHRDIRWDNVILNDSRAVLADLGTAVTLPCSDVNYRGGFICCPPRLLSDVAAPYTPEVADDLHAFLLLVNTLLYPKSVEGFMSVMVTDPDSRESQLLVQFWEDMGAHDFWQPYVRAAEEADHKTLWKLPGAIVMLQKEVRSPDGSEGAPEGEDGAVFSQTDEDVQAALQSLALSDSDASDTETDYLGDSSGDASDGDDEEVHGLDEEDDAF
ncbi:hypothetical protein FN846DRAFT_890009 [Sphaerosporella brunnea]|uniref:EKC/KEOPS complex subunit BUD32 n=1 Tax=Sphaerosporella brunnea TaxID=1250544 RepID=A0A5J5EXI0_9PEZI|nr:hypothetical protein FN846DRAFT_890009 [Sphaerosporella brunnea]